MDINDFRRTGRTTRMMREAVKIAAIGKIVVVQTYSVQAYRFLHEIASELTHSVVHPTRDVIQLMGGGQILLTTEVFGPHKFDHPPKFRGLDIAAVLVDPSVYEMHPAQRRVIEDYLRFASLSAIFHKRRRAATAGPGPEEISRWAQEYDCQFIQRDLGKSTTSCKNLFAPSVTDKEIPEPAQIRLAHNMCNPLKK